MGNFSAFLEHYSECFRGYCVAFQRFKRAVFLVHGKCLGTGWERDGCLRIVHDERGVVSFHSIYAVFLACRTHQGQCLGETCVGESERRTRAACHDDSPRMAVEGFGVVEHGFAGEGADGFADGDVDVVEVGIAGARETQMLTRGEVLAAFRGVELAAVAIPLLYLNYIDKLRKRRLLHDGGGDIKRGVKHYVSIAVARRLPFADSTQPELHEMCRAGVFLAH